MTIFDKLSKRLETEKDPVSRVEIRYRLCIIQMCSDLEAELKKKMSQEDCQRHLSAFYNLCECMKTDCLVDSDESHRKFLDSFYLIERKFRLIADPEDYIQEAGRCISYVRKYWYDYRQKLMKL